MTIQLLLTLMAPTHRRDEWVNALMAQEDLSGCALSPALGHSREHATFNVAEQVCGYRDMDRFKSLLSEQLPEVLSQLNAVAGAETIRFWTVALHNSGRIT
jgi:Protein of unknown function (DUF3240).